MKTFRITIYNEISKKKRRINIESRKMQEAIEMVEFHHMNHVVDEILKVEKRDKK